MTELSGLCCAGIMLVTPQEIVGMGRFEAFLADGQNAERASSQCLFACLQFEDTVTGGRVKIGCDASCDNWFGCTHPNQSGGTRHCCEFANQGLGRVKDPDSYTGYVHDPDLPLPKVRTKSISDNIAVCIMAANFAAPVLRWWELLPEKLTSYRVCQHVINMLKKQDPDRATTRSISAIFNPATKEYDKVATEEDASPAAPITRKQLADKDLCANNRCAHGKGGGRKKKPKGKVDRKKQFISNLCPA